MTIKKFISKPEEISVYDFAISKKLKITDTKKPSDEPLYRIIGDSYKKDSDE